MNFLWPFPRLRSMHIHTHSFAMAFRAKISRDGTRHTASFSFELNRVRRFFPFFFSCKKKILIETIARYETKGRLS